MAKRYKKYRDRRINKSKIALIFGLVIVVFMVLGKGKVKGDEIPIDNVMAMRISAENISAVKELSVKYNINFTELITYYCMENNFFNEKIELDDKLEQNLIMNYDNIKGRHSKKQFELYYKLIGNIIDEVKCFPINGESSEYIYGDSWGAERTYGGSRIHMGCDIMDRENIRGRLNVVSMTDGTIENIGWNEKGGWRVGIRGASGNYYYYAHLDSYAETIKKGDVIKAGDILGYMGDTGYSKVEGTKGNFEVHLHIGISPNTELSNDEMWINPYPFLRNIEMSMN